MIPPARSIRIGKDRTSSAISNIAAHGYGRHDMPLLIRPTRRQSTLERSVVPHARRKQDPQHEKSTVKRHDEVRRPHLQIKGFDCHAAQYISD